MMSSAYFRQLVRTAALGVTLLSVVSGCAARSRPFPSRFVKPGEPSTSFDAPGAAPKIASKPEDLSDYARRLRSLQATARTNISVGNTLESHDPALASALLKLRMLPTAASHREVAQAYAKAGITDFAYRHYRQALQIEPCDSSAFEGLARLWRQWGAPDLGLGDAHRAVNCRPGSASAYNTLGTLLVALGQLEPATAAFEFARRLDPGAAFALNNLCYVALQKGDGPAAQKACERALDLEPSMVAAQANLAMAYALQGKVSIAEDRLLNGADAATGLYNVGVLRMSMNQYGAAATAFESAADIRPSLADAPRRAGSSQSSGGGGAVNVDDSDGNPGGATRAEDPRGRRPQPRSHHPVGAEDVASLGRTDRHRAGSAARPSVLCDRTDPDGHQAAAPVRDFWWRARQPDLSLPDYRCGTGARDAVHGAQPLCGLRPRAAPSIPRVHG